MISEDHLNQMLGFADDAVKQGGHPHPSMMNNVDVCAETVRSLVEEVRRMKAAVVKHHSQKADDRCWLDDDELYAAFGLPPADFAVGDKKAMLSNCERFLDKRCTGGTWPTYAELEQTIENLKRGVTAFHRWSEVEVVAAVGTEFGVLRDETGLLTVVVRPSGQPWPHGLVPTEAMNTIHEGYTRYVVTHVPEDDESKNDPGS